MIRQLLQRLSYNSRFRHFENIISGNPRVDIARNKYERYFNILSINVAAFTCGYILYLHQKRKNIKHSMRNLTASAHLFNKHVLQNSSALLALSKIVGKIDEKAYTRFDVVDDDDIISMLVPISGSIGTGKVKMVCVATKQGNFETTHLSILSGEDSDAVNQEMRSDREIEVEGREGREGEGEGEGDGRDGGRRVVLIDKSQDDVVRPSSFFRSAILRSILPSRNYVWSVIMQPSSSSFRLVH
eukprot:TRINITY_DN6567_c1_g1_i2.p1 TRINITY_DN6567_c1_g1~~TRINITY_DN6567_c1_g1_i2.p1  ORF type:complete len:243 (-),score=71.89 TRINITY_DN6567_c1_g1_i2:118-846(-)